MKPALIFLIASVALTVSNAAPRHRANRLHRVRGRFRPADFRRVNLGNQRHLLGPNGENPFIQNIRLNRRPEALSESPAGSLGNSPAVLFVRQQRSQLSGNFGPNAVPPGRVRPSQVRSPGPDVPPDPNITEPPAQNLVTMSNEEREEIALNFFVMANYTPTGLVDKRSAVRLMQRNYGLPQTGELDDNTVAHMMAPRCGYPDAPANYQTFGGNPRWNKNPVTYQIKGYTPDISPCQVRNALKRALRVWEEVIELNFEETDDDSADLIIFFGYQEHGDGYPFDERNGLLAHAFTAGTTPIAGDTHFDEAEYWTLGEEGGQETYYGNSNGVPCVFPFIFKNREYTTCTSAGRTDGLEWCSTTRNFDTDGKFGFCPQETLFTYGGNANGDPCEFPFTFQGRTYDHCTYDGRTDGYRWCATTGNYEQDNRWGFCPDRAHATFGGNSDGAPCVFPFTFNGNEYSDCTIIGRDDYMPWCSTTANYDTDRKYGFCQDSGYSLFLVAAHEFGHAIGLDHSFEPKALMYPTYQVFSSNFRLPDDDRRGILSLYSPRRSALQPLQLEICGGDLTETDGQNTTATTSTDDEDTVPGDETTNNQSVCDNERIDALLYLGREIFVFKGRKFWRMFDPKGDKQGPYVISEQWPGLPRTIDAVYKRPGDDSLVFFKGTRFWVYDGFQLRAGYPKRVTALGLPQQGDLEVNGALNWLRSKNRKRTYFFVGNKYYRFSEERNRMDRGYPKSMSAWRRVPTNIEAAMEDPSTKRKSLFVKNNIVYVLHNYKVEVIETIPVDVWFGCRERTANAAPLVSRRRKDRKSP